MSPPSEREQLSFLTNLQRLLSEGQFVATWSYSQAAGAGALAWLRGDLLKFRDSHSFPVCAIRKCSANGERGDCPRN